MQLASHLLEPIEQLLIDTTISCFKVAKVLKPYLKEAPEGIYLLNDSETSS